MRTSELDSYMLELVKAPLLTGEQEVELANQRDTGDLEAVHKFIIHNMRLVARYALKYYKSDNVMPLSDLLSEGSIGLYFAALKFDQTKGYKFSTYAVWWIKQRIKRALNEQGHTIRVPDYMLDRLSQLMKNGDQTFNEVIKSLDIEDPGTRVAILRAWLAVGKHWVHFEDAIVAEDTFRYASVRAQHHVDDPTDHESLLIDLREELQYYREKEGDERNYDVVASRYGLVDDEPKTLERVGQIFSLSRERVRQIEVKVLGKLRKRLERKEGQRSRKENN